MLLHYVKSTRHCHILYDERRRRLTTHDRRVPLTPPLRGGRWVVVPGGPVAPGGHLDGQHFEPVSFKPDTHSVTTRIRPVCTSVKRYART